ncbi:MAG: TetR family transcriptional regulator [Actinophytocola sp.]|nr:TetR family transcriptional regulator [Actinophytocola sp.]
MPKLWNNTIEAHRREVREAIIDATASLVGEHGVLGVTMSGVAQRSGIGRATLYKYFPDVEAILHAWHHRQIDAHLAELAALRDSSGAAVERLRNVLHAYARIAHQRTQHDPELGAVLHRTHQGGHGADARSRLHTLLTELIADGAADGSLRTDVSADELAQFCLHALDAATGMPEPDAVHRLVAVTMAGLQPQA